MNMEQEQLNGNEKDLAHEIALCEPMIFNALRAQGLSHHDAEDIAQTAMEKAIKAQDSFDGKSAVSTWVYRIAMNAKIDMLRKTGQTNEISVSSFTEGDKDDGGGNLNRLLYKLSQLHSTEDLPDRSLIREEDKAIVRDLIDKLDDKHRDVIYDKYFADLSYGQIAEKRGIPSGLVGSRLHYGLKELRDLISDHLHHNGTQLPKE